jgi:hypothetical protein
MRPLVELFAGMLLELSASGHPISQHFQRTWQERTNLCRKCNRATSYPWRVTETRPLSRRRQQPTHRSIVFCQFKVNKSRAHSNNKTWREKDADQLADNESRLSVLLAVFRQLLRHRDANRMHTWKHQLDWIGMRFIPISARFIP